MESIFQLNPMEMLNGTEINLLNGKLLQLQKLDQTSIISSLFMENIFLLNQMDLFNGTEINQKSGKLLKL
jgi:hypothetical protein